MKVLVFFLLTFVTGIEAKTLKIDIYSDNISDAGFTSNDLAGKMLLVAYNELKNGISINFMRSSLTREWLSVENKDNVCLFNKSKTPAREKVATFSKYPLIAFPPLRLITKKGVNIPKQLSLKDALEKNNLRIGVISSRSYGAEIDNIIAKGHQNFITLEGKEASQRQRAMLHSDRVDAIIEYWPTLVVEYKNSKQLASYSIHQLNEANQYIFGYIACSQSPLGEEVISQFDRVMSSQSYFDLLIEEHKQNMPEEEIAPLKAALTYFYKHTPHNN